MRDMDPSPYQAMEEMDPFKPREIWTPLHTSPWKRWTPSSHERYGPLSIPGHGRDGPLQAMRDMDPIPGHGRDGPLQAMRDMDPSPYQAMEERAPPPLLSTTHFASPLHLGCVLIGQIPVASKNLTQDGVIWFLGNSSLGKWREMLHIK